MNEVRLEGWFATETSPAATPSGEPGVSFIIGVLRPNDRKEAFFRVFCVGEAAKALSLAREARLLRGARVTVLGSLRHEREHDGLVNERVYVRADTIKLGGP